MPLKDFGRDQPVYLDRYRVFLDSREKLVEETRADGTGFWRGEYSIGTTLSDVVGFELVGYQLRRDIAPTFWRAGTGKGTAKQGNNWLDLRIADVPETASLEFSVEFQPGTLTRDLGVDGLVPTVDGLVGFLNRAMDAEGDATFNTGNGYSFSLGGATTVESRRFGNLGLTNGGMPKWFVLRLENGGDETVCSLQLKFGTGPNAANSAWRVLGFEEGVDAVTDPVTGRQPLPLRPMELRPVRYVDVIVEEAGEDRNPVRRVYFEDGVPTQLSFITGADGSESVTRTEPSLSRVLEDQSPRRMSTVNVRLEFEGGVVPPASHELPYDLVLDVLHLSPEISLPSWVQQGFGF